MHEQISAERNESSNFVSQAQNIAGVVELRCEMMYTLHISAPL